MRAVFQLRGGRAKSSTHLRPLQVLRLSKRWSSSGPRILFCGSDEFSATSLQYVDELRRAKPSAVASLDVVCKRGKPAGRGLKTIRDVPLKAFAKELKLPIHEIPSFTGWEPPPVDLIIAVSFGLKVPPRLLHAARYGGWNLHPSLLPDLRGPAPLHHALLEGRKSSGITLQTLHPEHFDQGLVVSQRRFEIPNGGVCTFEEFRNFVSPIAAEVLVEGLVNGRYARDDHPPQAQEDSGALTHARKLGPEDAMVDWDTWGTERILRTQRALGSVWSRHEVSRVAGKMRVQWHDLQVLSSEGSRISKSQDLAIGRPALAVESFDDSRNATVREIVVLRTRDGTLLSPQSVTIEGRKRHENPAQGAKFLLRL